MPFTILTAGSFTSTAGPVQLPMPSSPDYFTTDNVTQQAASNPDTVIQGRWYGAKFGPGASPAGQGIKVVKTTADLTGVFAAGTGFTYVSTIPVVEAANTSGATITAASPAVVTQTNTYNAGDIIQFYGTTGMRQIAGMNFQISSASGSGYTLKGLQAVGFAAPASAGITRRISKYLAVDPQYLFVTGITQANQAVITTSVNPGNYYVAGMKIRLSVPGSFGMTQMDGLTATIISIDQTNYLITTNINSSAFSAFAFPADAIAPTAPLFATLAPAGASTTFDPVAFVATGYNFQYQPFQTGQFTPYMYLAGGAQSPAGGSSDVINWIAYKFEN